MRKISFLLGLAFLMAMAFSVTSYASVNELSATVSVVNLGDDDNKEAKKGECSKTAQKTEASCQDKAKAEAACSDKKSDATAKKEKK